MERLDERGARCPAPIIALGRARRRLDPGTEVVLLADDPVAATDVPAWCRMTGATLLAVRPLAGVADEGQAREYVIRLP